MFVPGLRGPFVPGPRLSPFCCAQLVSVGEHVAAVSVHVGFSHRFPTCHADSLASSSVLTRQK